MLLWEAITPPKKISQFATTDHFPKILEALSPACYLPWNQLDALLHPRGPPSLNLAASSSLCLDSEATLSQVSNWMRNLQSILEL